MKKFVINAAVSSFFYTLGLLVLVGIWRIDPHEIGLVRLTAGWVSVCVLLAVGQTIKEFTDTNL